VSVRVIVRTFSELCVTVGAVIVLFVVYVLFWTGVRADRAMDDQIDALHEQWDRQTAGPAPSASPTGAAPQPSYRGGRPFAVMYIPRLGFTWNKPVLEGTDCVVALRALGEDTRVRIVGLLLQSPLDVNEIAARLGVSQYNVSKHLRILREAGLSADEIAALVRDGVTKAASNT